MVVHPFPHFQGRRVANAISGSFRLGDYGWKDAVQREAEVSKEEERGGSHAGQDGEAEWVGGAVEELLGEGLSRFGHVVVGLTPVST